MIFFYALNLKNEPPSAWAISLKSHQTTLGRDANCIGSILKRLEVDAFETTKKQENWHRWMALSDEVWT